MPYIDWMGYVQEEPERTKVWSSAFTDPATYDQFPDCFFGRVPIDEHRGGDELGNGFVTFPGRRNRVLAGFARYLYRSDAHHAHWFTTGGTPDNKPVFITDHRLTFREAFEALMGDSYEAEQAREWLSEQPIQKGGAIYRLDSIPAEPMQGRPARLHRYLHDLALMIRWDLTEAIKAHHEGGYYPGVDVAPIPDTHVELVIWEAQRELDRERRQVKGGTKMLDPYPLASLPFSLQRAFVERRRLRYQEWGITPESWAGGSWSVFGVPDDQWEAPWVPK